MMGRGFLERVQGDLPGQWSVQVSDAHADFFVRDLVAVRVEVWLDVPRRRYGAAQTVHRSALEEGQADLWNLALSDYFWRAFRPWERPDAPAFPPLDLFPTLARLGRFLRRRP